METQRRQILARLTNLRYALRGSCLPADAIEVRVAYVDRIVAGVQAGHLRDGGTHAATYMTLNEWIVDQAQGLLTVCTKVLQDLH